MIKDIDFIEHDGYLEATIDNQTLSLDLKEIVKDEVIIYNNAETGIPLYTPIPINVNLETDKNNIVNKGILELKILDNDKVIYETNGYISEGRYITTIDEYLKLGTYIIEITYNGSKYFNKSKLSYYLTIEKRPLLFNIDKKQYHGKPYEDTNIHLGIYDAINKNPITNTRIDYIYNNIHYITKSNNKGEIDFQITIPNECEGSSIFIYIENDIYEYTSTDIKIITDRLNTEIQNTCSFDENNLILRGNVFAYNKDIMYNAQYGNIELYIEEDKVDRAYVEDGIFQLQYNYHNIFSEYISEEETVIKNKSDIDVKIDLETEINNIPGEVKFIVQVTDYNNKNITDGVVYFQLNNSANYYIAELDENGQAICYFYIPESGNYKIKYRYFGIFEYKDSEIKEKTIEVR